MKRVWAILHFFTQFGFIVFTYLKSHYQVGWVVRVSVAEQSERNPTLSRILLGFAVAQPNLHFLNRQVLPPDSYLPISSSQSSGLVVINSLIICSHSSKFRSMTSTP